MRDKTYTVVNAQLKKQNCSGNQLKTDKINKYFYTNYRS